MKKYLIYIFLFILGIGILLIQINQKYTLYFSKKTLNIKLPPKITNIDCNTTYLAKNNLWIKLKEENIKTKKTIKNNYSNNEITINKNIIIINNKKYIYIGDFNDIPIFLTRNKNTRFIKLKINNKLPESNITLIKNTKKELILTYKNKLFKIQKPFFIDISKYQKKDNNESKN